MQTLIDKIKIAGSSNIPTVGFRTLLLLLANGESGADDYEGTAAEAVAIKDDITVTISDNAAGTSSSTLDSEYIRVRTQADTKNALLEIVLTEAYINTITLPDDVTASASFLTFPANSEV